MMLEGNIFLLDLDKTWNKYQSHNKALTVRFFSLSFPLDHKLLSEKYKNNEVILRMFLHSNPHQLI